MSAGRVAALQLDKLGGSATAQCGKALPGSTLPKVSH